MQIMRHVRGQAGRLYSFLYKRPEDKCVWSALYPICNHSNRGDICLRMRQKDNAQTVKFGLRGERVPRAEVFIRFSARAFTRFV